ncbi:acyl-CoA dehydrogenase family protein [Streptomyces sp. SBT349]|uniref:acyl-CoA dehydrogenase family protein n=1 Tax=Streptomyces sp. SBT349 TaxID=1580539 RepID=UPI00066DB0F5|nr:acyl-CoA dehydrogenase family protein [Streptomyces sp. SBT349]
MMRGPRAAGPPNRPGGGHRTLAAEVEQVRREVRHRFAGFVRESVNPGSSFRESGGRDIDRSVIEAAGALGLISLSLPVEAGGAGWDKLAWGAVVEEIARLSRDPAFSALLDTTVAITELLLSSGRPELIERHVPDLVAGRRFAALGAYESRDPHDYESTARREGDAWVLNGAKPFITGARFADLFVLLLRDEASHDALAFVVEVDDPGVTMLPLGTMGLRTLGLGQVLLHDVRVPASRLVRGADAISELNSYARGRRMTTACAAVGALDSMIEGCVESLSARRRGGRRVLDHPNVERSIGEMRVLLEASRAGVYRALDSTRSADRDPYFDELATVAKHHTTECALRVGRLVMNLMGAEGYMNAFPWERSVRDVLGLIGGQGSQELLLIQLGQRTIVALEGARVREKAAERAVAGLTDAWWTLHAVEAVDAVGVVGAVGAVALGGAVDAVGAVDGVGAVGAVDAVGAVALGGAVDAVDAVDTVGVVGAVASGGAVEAVEAVDAVDTVDAVDAVASVDAGRFAGVAREVVSAAGLGAADMAGSSRREALAALLDRAHALVTAVRSGAPPGAMPPGPAGLFEGRLADVASRAWGLLACAVALETGVLGRLLTPCTAEEAASSLRKDLTRDLLEILADSPVVRRVGDGRYALGEGLEPVLTGGPRASAFASRLRRALAGGALLRAGGQDAGRALTAGCGDEAPALAEALVTSLLGRLEGLAELLSRPGATVGCAAGDGGRSAAVLARHLPGARVLALEPGGLATGVAPAGTVLVRVGDAADFGEDDRLTLAWLPVAGRNAADLRGAVTAAAAALVPSGWIVLPCPLLPRHPLGAATARLDLAVAGGTPLPPGEVEALLRTAGLGAVRTAWEDAALGIRLIAARRP